MDEFIEFEGKNIDEAISNACKHYKVERAKLEIEIIKEAKTGIFGLVGNKKALIKARCTGNGSLLKDVSQEKENRGIREAGRKEPRRGDGRQRDRRPREARQREGTPKDAAPNDAAPKEGNQKEDIQKDVLQKEAGQGDSGQKEARQKDGRRRDARQPGRNRNERNRSGGGRNERRGQERKPRQNGRPNRSEPGNRPEPGNRIEPGNRMEDHLPDPSPAEAQSVAQTMAQDLSYGEYQHLPQEQYNPELVQLIKTTVVRLVAPIVESEELDLDIEFTGERVKVTVNDDDHSGLIIGREGQTLSAIQYLANRIVAKNWEEPIRIQLDTGDYRERQDDNLRQLAFHLADKVRDMGRPQSTKPLSSYHRRVVHMALQSEDGIHTRSKGEGPLKRVLILPKRERRNGNRSGNRRQN